MWAYICLPVQQVSHCYLFLAGLDPLLLQGPLNISKNVNFHDILDKTYIIAAVLLPLLFKLLIRVFVVKSLHNPTLAFTL